MRVEPQQRNAHPTDEQSGSMNLSLQTIYASAVIVTIDGPLTTTIQVDEKTRKELFRVVSELEREKGRRVTFDEAIMALIERERAKESARAKFHSLYGTLGPDGKAWSELRRLRRAERDRLEKVVEATR
jgi:hypothetical protein